MTRAVSKIIIRDISNLLVICGKSERVVGFPVMEKQSFYIDGRKNMTNTAVEELKINSVISRFEKQYEFPEVVLKVSEILDDETSNIADLEEILRLDPILTSRIIFLAGSAFFGGRNITSLDRAIAYLGRKNIYNCVIMEPLQRIYSSTRTSTFPKRKLWMHSIAVATLGKMISERLLGIDGEEAYLIGLFHDVGLLIEDQILAHVFPKVYDEWTSEQPDILQHETEYLGITHCQLGEVFSRKVKIFDELGETIRNHHSLDHTLAPDSRIGVLQLTEYLSTFVGYGLKEGVTAPISDSLKEHLLDTEGEYKLIVDDFPEEIKKAEEILLAPAEKK